MGSRREQLICHPGTPPGRPYAVWVQVDYRVNRATSLSYVDLIFDVVGDTGAIVLPSIGDHMTVAATAENGLWRSTCFELFMGSLRLPAYVEYNFAPDGRWASYHFTAYRARGRDISLPPHTVGFQRSPSGFAVQVCVPIVAMDGPQTTIGLSAVIEEVSGHKSYWALRHPGGQPDFHAADCFAVQLGPPDPA